VKPQARPGIAIAVGLSILNVFRRAWRPYQTTLGLVDDLPGYHDVRSYPSARLLPGLVLYRFDAPLFFANAKTFRDEVVAIARADPAPVWIVVAAEPITDVDTTAADVLFDLDHLLDSRGQSLVFAGLKDPVRRKIDVYGLTAKIEPAQRVAALLVDQLTGPVRFTQAATELIRTGATTFVEVGPGNVLSGLVKRIDRGVKTMSVNSIESLERAQEALAR